MIKYIKNKAMSYISEANLNVEANPNVEAKPNKARSVEDIVASGDFTVTEMNNIRNNLAKLTPQQMLERLAEQTMRSKKEVIAHTVNKKYSMSDSDIVVVSNHWYSIQRPEIKDVYNIYYKLGKCYIVTHLSTIKYCCKNVSNTIGLRGTEEYEHMSFQEFENIVRNGVSVESIARSYKIVDIVKKDNIDEDYWKATPVYNTTN